MKAQYRKKTEPNMHRIINQVRDLIQRGQYHECYAVIVDEMKNSPHAPEPHNLMGMLLEWQGNHQLAMRHFRVAWDLDQTYLPARHNLDVYESFYVTGTGAYDESDCPAFEEKKPYTKEYDAEM